jgi:hypothetical protein
VGLNDVSQWQNVDLIVQCNDHTRITWPKTKISREVGDIQMIGLHRSPKLNQIIVNSRQTILIGKVAHRNLRWQGVKLEGLFGVSI